MLSASKEKYRGVFKIYMNGTSAVLTLARPVMFAMNALPGEWLEISVDEDGIGHLRRWVAENANTGRGPGQIVEKPEALTK